MSHRWLVYSAHFNRLLSLNNINISTLASTLVLMQQAKNSPSAINTADQSLGSTGKGDDQCHGRVDVKDPDLAKLADWCKKH